ncbi:hypothetical protein PDJAM_G00237200 [Pangasius djambal]|uniref:Uncharacterized protein n=1 Tax=Pangasius djambal TaxID=1691987 RepID=A0ACC5YG79_9TELE|nr:hypothetical protein [Pangasius djambal]
MKFAEHLSAHITPEWRKQYIQYEAFKEMLYAAQDQAPSIEVTDEDTVKRYYAKFEEKFFQTCEKELSKINTFYSEKLAEAQRRFSTLQNELQTSVDAQRESIMGKSRKTGLALSHEERNKHRNIKDLKLAFSEFYLSLILLQNYQNLNFTGFRKILKKHDKILETQRGADWRVSHVEVAPFYTCKKITQLISETETLVTTELEGGDRQKAMKRLRVPPLGAAQPAPAWTTFRVGLYCGIFIVLTVTFILSGAFYFRDKNVWPMVRMYRGGFLLIQFLFLLGINTYGWRQAGVNHVLIFELNPRNNLSHQHLFEIAGFLGVLWCVSILLCLYADTTGLPMQASPLILYGLMFLFLINPFKTAYYKSRFWLLKLLFRVFTAPFHRVEFADFWLADQLNSLVIVLMDLEYLVCFYSVELQWGEVDGLLPDYSDDKKCNNYSYGLRAIIQCLPAWFRFVQCLRRYRDTKRAFPHLFRVFTAPFHRVEFADFWLADQLNSLVIVLMDLEYLVCFYSVELQWGEVDGLLPDYSDDKKCNNYSYGLRAIIQCLPAWFRFVQCLRRYRDTKRAFPHLVNAGKYSTTFFVVAFSALYSTHKDQDDADAEAFLYLLIVFSTISSLYTLIWDLKMDWGLFDRNAGEHTFLREEIVYPQKAYYYCAIVEDVILRFSWTLQIALTNITHVSSADVVATALAPLEVFRRFVWNFFRLENEHLNNCGEFRAVRDISVAPLNADDQTLLEQMMDHEDGVKHRQGKKTWRRSYSLTLRRPLLHSQSKKDTKVLIEDTDDEPFS